MGEAMITRVDDETVQRAPLAELDEAESTYGEWGVPADALPEGWDDPPFAPDAAAQADRFRIPPACHNHDLLRKK